MAGSGSLTFLSDGWKVWIAYYLDIKKTTKKKRFHFIIISFVVNFSSS